MIDIIIATYDRPQWLDECLASISGPMGIIVVDDASPTDDAKAICAKHGARYIRHAANTGVAGALATGWEASDAPFTSFWGDDDIMLPNWYALNRAASEGYDVVANSYNLVNSDLSFRQTYVLNPMRVEDLRNDIVWVNDGALLRRDAVPELRPERERAMMLTLWLAMAHAGARFTTISEPTWLYRRHDRNLSGSLPLQREPRFAQLRQEAIAEYV